MMAALLLAVLATGCASAPAGDTIPRVTADATAPESVHRDVGGLTIGEPIGVTLDFLGNPVIADGVPGRLLGLNTKMDRAIEFETPTTPGFYPIDLKYTGFFVYALDAVGRLVLRFDKDGAYRDVIINLDDASGRRISPVGLDVDDSGRIAVTDVRNHQVILFDGYLVLELVFGNYGSFPGQLDSPEGIAFTSSGGFAVTDSGNRRVQFFDEGGRYVRMVPPEGSPNPLRHPRRAVTDKQDNIYVADPEAGAVFVFDGHGALVRSIAPNGEPAFRPTDVEVTSSGLIYVTDTGSNSLYVFR